ncbi:MAG: tRNA 2-thiouridine(34) synthase MnmA [Firmicutes bacterium]|nr:tRNA 2-thiouridine(34) synthase MnmA [Bacillota bacterium]
MAESKHRGRVLVAMSGGVDSSVAAALLQEQGYDVYGATMRLWASETADERAGGCCSLASVEDARRVAHRLGIPFYVLNFRDAFRTQIVEQFIAEYKAGRTPNPCIACNRHMKFDLFLQKALALGLDYIATGHYARRVCDDSGRCWIEKAADEHKDQTYALYNIKPEQLAHILFPLGDLRKDEVREVARRYHLPTAEKEESQEICFIPDNDYRRWLSDEVGLPSQPGNIVNRAGQVLGQHTGIYNFTIGQRRGLGIVYEEPLYVIAIRPEQNEVVVGTRDEVWSYSLLADDVNLLYWPCTDSDPPLAAKIRYSAAEVPCEIELLPDRQMRVFFQQPVRAATPGQAVVVYAGRKVVGGGTIQRIIE